MYNVLVEVTGGHFGVLKTYSKLRKRYYWKNMFADCEHWVKVALNVAQKDTKSRIAAYTSGRPLRSVSSRCFRARSVYYMFQ